MFRAIGRTMMFAASMAWRGVSHVARDVSNYMWQRAGPQGAAELSQAIFSQSTAHVPYGHAQAPVRPVNSNAAGNALAQGNWSDKFTAHGRTGQAQTRGMAAGM
jgi:hypothetical protein